jgi:hypothetical protein
MIQLMFNPKVSAFNPIGTLRHMPIYLKLLATAMFGAMTGINCVGNAELEVQTENIKPKSSITFEDGYGGIRLIFIKLVPGDTQKIEWDIKADTKTMLEYRFWLKEIPGLEVTITDSQGQILPEFALNRDVWRYGNHGTSTLVEHKTDGKMIITVKNNSNKLADFWMRVIKVSETAVTENVINKIEDSPEVYKLTFKKDVPYLISKDRDVDYLNDQYVSVIAPFYRLNYQAIQFDQDTDYYFVFQRQHQAKGFFKLQKFNEVTFGSLSTGNAFQEISMAPQEQKFFKVNLTKDQLYTMELDLETQTKMQNGLMRLAIVKKDFFGGLYENGFGIIKPEQTDEYVLVITNVDTVNSKATFKLN